MNTVLNTVTAVVDVVIEGWHQSVFGTYMWVASSTTAHKIHWARLGEALRLTIAYRAQSVLPMAFHTQTAVDAVHSRTCLYVNCGWKFKPMQTCRPTGITELYHALPLAMGTSFNWQFVLLSTYGAHAWYCICPLLSGCFLHVSGTAHVWWKSCCWSITSVWTNWDV